ncbi:MAG: 2-aminoethylphosphonate aminotransferase [Terriglobales bacterium]
MVLMNPGPVMVDERVRAALTRPDMCHREAEFSALMTAVREKVTRVCGGGPEYSSIVITGSGTASLEAVISSVIPSGGRLLVLDNGHYGERLAAIAGRHRVPCVSIERGWSHPFDPAQLERALQADPQITHVAVVHHETSTGMLNPLHAIGEIAARHGRWLIVDAISSVGGEIFGVCEDNVAWCIGTANKCIEGIAGLSFVTAPKKNWEALKAIPARTYYLDLWKLYAAQEHQNAPPFTPAVQAFFAFDVALDLMLEEGVGARHQRYAALAAQLRAGLDAAGFELLLPAEHRSNTLTAIYLPEGMNYSSLHDRLREAGFAIYAGQDALKNRVFRLANMGQITAADIGRFLDALGRVLASSAGGRAGLGK